MIDEPEDDVAEDEELEEEELEEEEELPKTGAAAWKERRAAIMGQGAAKAEGGDQGKKRADNRVSEQRRRNAERDAAQLRSRNDARIRKSPRG